MCRVSKGCSRKIFESWQISSFFLSNNLMILIRSFFFLAQKLSCLNFFRCKVYFFLFGIVTSWNLGRKLFFFLYSYFSQSTQTFVLPMCVSLSFLLLPLWSIGHPWIALFHFSFLILKQSVGLLGRGISPSQGRYLHRATQNKRRQTSMPWLVYEPTIPVFERTKTLHALDCAVTVIGNVCRTWKFSRRNSMTEWMALGLRSNIKAGNNVGLGTCEWAGT
jgi:hypothetical protein